MDRRAALAMLTAAVLHPRGLEARETEEVLRGCRQLLRVESADWHSTSGRLTLWERVRAGRGWTWRRQGLPVPVVLGRSGLRWGRGWHSLPRGAAVKREGDGCSPAGIFSLDTAFGSLPAKASGVRHWPYARMTPAWAGVDDPRSRYYNRIVDSSTVKRDWRSAENMMPKSGVYRRGLVVRHNWPQVRGGGSCIFLHLWQGPGSTTAGCTAMAERDLVRILNWLDPAHAPLLVQLPSAEWRKRSAAWGLP